jgi:hypothetical protein
MLQTQMIMESWNLTVKRVSDLFLKLSEDKIMKEVAPNRNKGIYLLGHLTASHDSMLPLLGFRELMFPELKNYFLISPDNINMQPFTVAELLEKWMAVNDELKKHFNNLSTEDWLQKHTAISDEDFVKEPHRNRLNVVLSRTNHLSYHQGQLILLQ